MLYQLPIFFFFALIAPFVLALTWFGLTVAWAFLPGGRHVINFAERKKKTLEALSSCTYILLSISPHKL